MHVSYGELVRIGPEAIRMLGFAFGQADDCVEGVVWTQCVLGRGYQMLRMADELRPPSGWPGHVCIDAGGAVVDLRGLRALAFAARLTDLARCRAAASDGDGAGLVMAYGAFGGWIAPFMAFALVRAGYVGNVLWLPSSTPHAGEAPATLLGTTAASNGAADNLLVAPAPIYEAVPPGTGAELGGVPAPVARRLEELIAEAGNESVLAVAARRGCRAGPDASLAPAIAGRAELDAQEVGWLHYGHRLQQAIAAGLEVDPDDHGVLARLAQRVRLPNSERSRAQAG
jgi:hypothetical protein